MPRLCAGNAFGCIGGCVWVAPIASANHRLLTQSPGGVWLRRRRPRCSFFANKCARVLHTLALVVQLIALQLRLSRHAPMASAGYAGSAEPLFLGSDRENGARSSGWETFLQSMAPDGLHCRIPAQRVLECHWIDQQVRNQSYFGAETEPAVHIHR